MGNWLITKLIWETYETQTDLVKGAHDFKFLRNFRGKYFLRFFFHPLLIPSLLTTIISPALLITQPDSLLIQYGQVLIVEVRLYEHEVGT